MSKTSPSIVPEGWHTVTPRIVVHDAKLLVEFLKQVFDATGEYLDVRPSVVRIGDSLLMISDAGIRSPMTAFLYVYVDDTDLVYNAQLIPGRVWSKDRGIHRTAIVGGRCLG